MNSGQVKAYHNQFIHTLGHHATNKPVHFLNKRMAELVFELVSKLINQLGSIVYNDISLAWGVKSDLQKLEHTMFTIKDVLLDAEEKQAHNKKICNWVRQLKDVFLDAEDLLDEFDCEALRRKVMETSHETSRKVRRFFSRSNPIAFRFRVGLEIQEIRERLNELKANKAFFDLRTDHHHHHQGDHTRENMTHSFVTASKIIGRESEKKAIVDLLMQSGDDRNGSRNVSVIPIVGIGGLGKTALAKLVYNDERVVSHFQLRMWVYVSVNFDAIRMTKEILSSSYCIEVSDSLSLDQLQRKLRDALKDKRFLLVLDDVWNDDRIKWIEFRDLLIEGAKSGSKILVTTRNISVASIMGTVPMHINLRGLSHEDCMSLFLKCAFEEGQEEQHPNLFEIGKDIVKKCGGVPLAVRTLASQLYSKTDEQQWKLVRDSEIWELEREGGGHILPALRLSYTQLPSHLKQCLAYCSVLQKKYVQFDSRGLINYWMAHGILESHDHGSMELEDVGELYFRELWMRSFFENVKCYFDISYKFDMHDLIHDLIQSVAQEECSTVDSAGTKAISENVRHLSFSEFGQNVSTTLRKFNKVRTISGDKIVIEASLLHSCFSRFKYLRVLKLYNIALELLPRSIGRLKHLRYLGLTGNEAINKLPNEICKLQSLQTLFLGQCKNLEELPREINNLISLRSLVLTTKQTSFQENGLGCLKSLRYLFIVECSNLTSLPREMSYLVALRTLVINNCKQLDLANGNYQVIPLRLQKLFIVLVPGMVALPEWFRGAANTLQVLCIWYCENLDALPWWLTSFTSLRKLVLKSCPKLLSLPEGMHHLTALKEVQIADCPHLERRCQRDIGEDWEKISHVPHVSFSFSID